MEASQVDTATESAVNIEEKNLWIIDSLCGNHMTGNRKILSDRRSERQTFTTPNDSIQSLEIGNVRNSTVTLFNVLYCPGIRNNIMSEGQLDRDGYSCTRVAHKCMVQRRATQDTVGLAEQDENMMYYVDHCHCVRDPSQDDAAKNLKRQMQYEPSRSNSRKRIRYQMQYEPSRSNSRKRIR